MARLFKFATAASVVFCFLFAAIAYACPSLEFMGRAPMPLSMGMGMDGEKPCADIRIWAWNSVPSMGDPGVPGAANGLLVGWDQRRKSNGATRSNGWASSR